MFDITFVLNELKYGEMEEKFGRSGEIFLPPPPGIEPRLTHCTSNNLVISLSILDYFDSPITLLTIALFLPVLRLRILFFNKLVFLIIYDQTLVLSYRKYCNSVGA